jgi:hypothetical protein
MPRLEPALILLLLTACPSQPEDPKPEESAPPVSDDTGGTDTDTTDTCADECSPAGAEECHGDGIRSCGEFDGIDACTEWSEPVPCDDGLVCDPVEVACVEPVEDLPDPFTIVLLPDTQYYTDKLPDDPDNTYYLQAQWIIDHQASDDIVFAVHLGDVTDDNEVHEWEIASQAHGMLDAAGVPYSVLPGNHDYLDGGDFGRGDSRFGEYFGQDRFVGQPWYGGAYTSSNTNNYTTFEQGSLKFLVLSLEYAPRKDALCWADEVIAAHPDHRVIVATHCHQTHGGGYSTGCPNPDYTAAGHTPQAVWDELLARHSNIVMVAAGHIGDSEYRASTGNSGNAVHELLVDYQFEGACDEASAQDCNDHCRAGSYTGNGWLRLLRFEPQSGQITNQTVTVQDGNADLFPGGEPVLFCSDLFDPTDPSADGGDWYDQAPDDADHAYSIAMDLSVPVTYAYDDLGLRAFHDRTVNSEASGDQDSSVLAMGSDGAFIAAWEDDASSADGSGNLDVLVRGFEPCGCEAFADLAVHGDTSGDQREPAVAMGPSGDFLVAWADDTDDNGYYQIHARGFAADGTERIPEFTVNSVSDGQQRKPAVAVASDGSFVVAWADDQDRDGDYQIMVRGFATDGSERFADMSVHDDDQGERLAPTIGVDASGDFVVAWQDDTDGNGIGQIHARGFDASGTVRFDRITVNSVNDGQQQAPTIGVASSGAFTVAWEDDQERDGDYHILARSFDASGTAISEWTVASGGQHLAPTLSVAPGGATAIAWQDDGDSNGYYQLKAATWQASGATWRTAATINAQSAGQQTAPAVALADDGTMVVLWSDDMDNNDLGQIFAAGFDAP